MDAGENYGYAQMNYRHRCKNKFTSDNIQCGEADIFYGEAEQPCWIIKNSMKLFSILDHLHL